MTTPTSVELEGMRAALAAFREADSQARTQLSAMREQQSVLMSHWDGPAATSYGGALNAWLEDFQRVVSALDKMLNTLEQNTGVYSTTHEETQQAVVALKGKMHSALNLH
ncbi:WXG100 family type VII secretion target [Streptomyces sp. NPDC001739]|uniref:WXG100 family type VII secretion target n=1 Tax=unclassified Streptomyces TaxID=2593676 RepID=UPI00331A8B97